MKVLKYLSLFTLSLLTACVSNSPPMDLGPLPPQYNSPIEEGKQPVRNYKRSTKNEVNIPTKDTKLAQNKINMDDKNLVTGNGKLIETNPKAGKTQLTGKQIITGAKTAPSSWNLSGALAVRSQNKASTASINWYQRGAGSYQIRLFGPLGSGTIMIAKRGGVITLQDGAKVARSSNAEQLLLQQTGIRLPVSSLYYWVRGLPAPGGVQSAQRDSGNRLLLLRQGGYTIQYLGYRSVGKTVLPTHIRLQGNGVFIKLVINHWSV
ncbi:lipoprotein insertase outer membrane protein LolB [Legionella sp. D16C41]|uniref:lipoprotein insertase outer membrane protein LolB n=1 Tax=Legionella sp. D16C41 TaxID=3402688 RepID=UPI003AF9E107